jgi:hypothetical protein
VLIVTVVDDDDDDDDVVLIEIWEIIVHILHSCFPFLSSPLDE